MSTSSLKQCSNTAFIAVLKTRDKKCSALFQLILSSIKQNEVDEDIEPDNESNHHDINQSRKTTL